MGIIIPSFIGSEWGYLDKLKGFEYYETNGNQGFEMVFYPNLQSLQVNTLFKEDL